MAILSISREYQSGGRVIGKAVAQRLGYDFVDKNRIHADLKTVGEKWGRLVEEFDEVRPHLWEKFDWEYRGFIALIESAVYEYALKDNVVILGRGSYILLQEIPHVLKVRLFSPKEVRIERLMEDEKIDRETAEEMIKKTDQLRAGYLQVIYGKHWEDQQSFDLMFNTGHQTFEQVTLELMEALKLYDQRATEEGRRMLETLALTAKVKARIFTHPKLFIPTLEVFHDGLSIVIKGVVHNPKEFHVVEELIHETADPHPVRNELHFRK
jgi:cytidylate kinase